MSPTVLRAKAALRAPSIPAPPPLAPVLRQVCINHQPRNTNQPPAHQPLAISGLFGSFSPLSPPPPTPHYLVQVCTIHQPNSDITDLFDNFMLLATGRVVYGGLWEGAVPFFAQQGYRCGGARAGCHS